MPSVPNSGTPDSTDFQKITNAFIAAERIAAVFTRHQNLFDVDAVYSTTVMVWSFLGWVLRIPTTLLPSNLIRTTATTAALVHRKLPRQISFTSTCQ